MTDQGLKGAVVKREGTRVSILLEGTGQKVWREVKECRMHGWPPADVAAPEPEGVESAAHQRAVAAAKIGDWRQLVLCVFPHEGSRQAVTNERLNALLPDTSYTVLHQIAYHASNREQHEGAAKALRVLVDCGVRFDPDARTSSWTGLDAEERNKTAMEIALWRRRSCAASFPTELLELLAQLPGPLVPLARFRVIYNKPSGNKILVRCSNSVCADGKFNGAKASSDPNIVCGSEFNAYERVVVAHDGQQRSRLRIGMLRGWNRCALRAVRARAQAGPATHIPRAPPLPRAHTQNKHPNANKQTRPSAPVSRVRSEERWVSEYSHGGDKLVELLPDQCVPRQPWWLGSEGGQPFTPKDMTLSLHRILRDVAPDERRAHDEEVELNKGQFRDLCKLLGPTIQGGWGGSSSSMSKHVSI